MLWFLWYVERFVFMGELLVFSFGFDVISHKLRWKKVPLCIKTSLIWKFYHENSRGEQMVKKKKVGLLLCCARLLCCSVMCPLCCGVSFLLCLTFRAIGKHTQTQVTGQRCGLQSSGTSLKQSFWRVWRVETILSVFGKELLSRRMEQLSGRKSSRDCSKQRCSALQCH